MPVIGGIIGGVIFLSVILAFIVYKCKKKGKNFSNDGIVVSVDSDDKNNNKRDTNIIRIGSMSENLEDQQFHKNMEGNENIEMTNVSITHSTNINKNKNSNETGHHPHALKYGTTNSNTQQNRSTVKLISNDNMSTNSQQQQQGQQHIKSDTVIIHKSNPQTIQSVNQITQIIQNQQESSDDDDSNHKNENQFENQNENQKLNDENNSSNNKNESEIQNENEKEKEIKTQGNNDDSIYIRRRATQAENDEKTDEYITEGLGKEGQNQNNSNNNNSGNHQNSDDNQIKKKKDKNDDSDRESSVSTDDSLLNPTPGNTTKGDAITKGGPTPM